MRSTRSANLVVFDAFGTLVKIDNPTRPYALLAQHLQNLGIDVSDFAVRAMTGRHTLSSLAASYGASVSLEMLAHLEGVLLSELERIEPYPDADRTLRHVLNQGANVVVASNLAWPYALPVRSMLGHMVRERIGQTGGRLSTFFSFERGLLKPDPAFYQFLATEQRAQEGAAPSRIFMVGDKLLEDVSAPIQAGWSAWHLDRPSGGCLLDAPWDKWLDYPAER